MRVLRGQLRLFSGLRHFVCLSLFVAAFLACMLSARAENTEAKLDRLENEIQTLSRAIYKGEAPPPGSLDTGAAAAEVQANINNRLSQLETDLRNLTGQVEQQNYTIRNFQEKVERRLADLEARTAGYGGSMPSSTAPG